MSDITNSIYNLSLLDELARKESPVHRLHPLVKLLTTVAYLTVVVSFDRYEIAGLLAYVFYPVIIFALAELPFIPIVKRILLVGPLIIGIGILNPLFDNHTVVLGSIAVSRGWVAFFSIFIKGGLTVTAGVLLIATTGIDKLAAALRMLKVPRIFVLQLLLTYRYIYVLTEEVSRMVRAYSLRAPGQKGIHHDSWGSFLGQLLLRTFERAERVYESMILRGFSGEYGIGMNKKAGYRDFAFLMGWSAFFVIVRIYDIPALLGELFTGVII